MDTKETGKEQILDIAICDDNKQYAKILHEKTEDLILQKQYDYKIKEFYSSGDLIDYCDKNVIDILFMDIDMPNINGMDAALMIKEKKPDINVVFVTAHKEYAYQAFESKPAHFVIKSDVDRLERVIDELTDEIISKKNYSNSIYIDSNGKNIAININEAVYLESKRNYITVYNKKNKYLEFRGTIQDIYSQLSPYGFICANRSYIINCRYIQSIDRSKTVLFDGRSITNTRDYKKYKEMQKIFGKYLRDKV